VESNHVIPRYQRGAVTVWLTPCAWSRECSNLPLPGFNRPLRRQSFETRCSIAMGPAAGIEPAASRLRGERPYHQDLAGTIFSVMVWSEGVEPSSPVWRTGILAVGRRPRDLHAMDAREGLSPP
jgi:hypothetical protein